MGAGVPSPELKRIVREVNYSPSSSAEVKNEWRYSSAPPYLPSRLGQEKCTFFVYRSSYLFEILMFIYCRYRYIMTKQ